MPLSTIEEAIAEIRRGRMVILMDDKDRENEGDVCMAAEKVTLQAINFMATHGRGLICLPLTEERVKRLGVSMMVSENTSPFGTAFTVSIEAATGSTTGISAADRAKTILDAIADDAKSQDLVTPGHIFPLRARNGGVLVRAGQTEGSVDLARLAGLKPAGVICEIMKDDGTMARQPDLMKFARKHTLKVITIADLIQYRLNYDSLVYRADFKEYGIGAQILRDLGVRKMRLLTNNRKHLVGLRGYGLEITALEPIPRDNAPRDSGKQKEVKPRAPSARQ